MLKTCMPACATAYGKNLGKRLLCYFRHSAIVAICNLLKFQEHSQFANSLSNNSLDQTINVHVYHFGCF